jgi:hypothetical protein
MRSCSICMLAVCYAFMWIAAQHASGVSAMRMSCSPAVLCLYSKVAVVQGLKHAPYVMMYTAPRGVGGTMCCVGVHACVCVQSRELSAFTVPLRALKRPRSSLLFRSCLFVAMCCCVGVVGLVQL